MKIIFPSVMILISSLLRQSIIIYVLFVLGFVQRNHADIIETLSNVVDNNIGHYALLHKNNVKCIGFVATKNCNPNSDRDEDITIVPCWDVVKDVHLAGYCLLREHNEFGQERDIHVMKRTCHSDTGLAKGVFTCDLAIDFHNFRREALSYRHRVPVKGKPSRLLGQDSASSSSLRRGIVYNVFETALVGVYVSIQLIREYGCRLPIELWMKSSETNVHSPLMRLILEDVSTIVRFIEDPDITGFNVKPYSLFYSNFDEILLLDADNLPFTNPETLFETEQFRKKGALFFPDFWQPLNTIFNLQSEHLIWELTGLPVVDGFEQESGQLLIDRTRCLPALHALMFMVSVPPKHHTHRSLWQRELVKGGHGLIEQMGLLYGDKDMFRFAWMMTGTPFHFVKHLPGIVGLHREGDGDEFCGMTMLQHGPNGEPVFFHRNARKLDHDGAKWWTHGNHLHPTHYCCHRHHHHHSFVNSISVRRYRGNDPKRNYRVIGIGHGCFVPAPSITDTSVFSFETLEEAGFGHQFEDTILMYRREAIEARSAASNHDGYMTTTFEIVLLYLCLFVIIAYACKSELQSKSRVRWVWTWVKSLKRESLFRKSKD